jgi:hypothetical protein
MRFSRIRAQVLRRRPSRVVYGANHLARQLGEIGPPRHEVLMFLCNPSSIWFQRVGSVKSGSFVGSVQSLVWSVQSLVGSVQSLVGSVRSFVGSV